MLAAGSSYSEIRCAAKSGFSMGGLPKLRATVLAMQAASEFHPLRPSPEGAVLALARPAEFMSWARSWQ